MNSLFFLTKGDIDKDFENTQIFSNKLKVPQMLI